ncbi:MAG: spore germination protein [Bacillota bacterium]|nr:MAG: spore germination protein [Bacillota bacterium]
MLRRRAGLRRPARGWGAEVHGTAGGHDEHEHRVEAQRFHLARLARLAGRLAGRLDDLTREMQARAAAGALLGPGSERFTGRVHLDVARLEGALHHTADLVTRFVPGPAPAVAAFLYLEPLVDMRRLRAVVGDLEELARRGERGVMADPGWWEIGGRVGRADTLPHAVRRVLAGHAVLLLEGRPCAWTFDVRGFPRRAVEEPDAERLVRGPRDGLVEDLQTNLALIRMRLSSPRLVVRRYRLGDVAGSRVALLYVEGIAPPEVVQEAETRLHRVRSDALLDTGQLEQWLEDQPRSPFPQVMETERPDRVVANLLAGRVAFLVEGSPFAVVAPAVLLQFYQSPEDYYQRWPAATLVRMIREIAMAVSLLLPALYIAFVSFHPEMLPSTLAVLLASARSGVPFPAIGEAILLETAVEILREASIRLPGPIGPTISIVGGLIIGEMTVSAGLVSPAMVIVAGVTAIGSFAAPSYAGAIALRILRYPLMIAASLFGLYGVVIGLLLILIHLADLESFGLPYLYPLVPPRSFSNLKDTLVRAPVSAVLRGEGDTHR